MKDEAQELKDLLLKIGTFLNKKNENGWGNTSINMIDYVDVDLKEAKRIIRTWYGGMGSFQDIVFSKDGVVLVDENKYLYDLQHKLYDLASN